MAKHDQRILKFLYQNTDQPPTITEMMTRLNISIAEISESLGALQTQGLISKKTNNQGIECWFPMASSASPAAQAVPSAAMSGASISDRIPPPPKAPATAKFSALVTPIASDNRPTGEVRSALDPRFLNGLVERARAASERPETAPLAAHNAMAPVPPVQVQHMQYAVAEPAYAPISPPPPRQPVPNATGSIYGLAPAPRGIGVLTLLAGLVASVILSAFITLRLIHKEFGQASQAFVDRKALNEAKAALVEFQEKTKVHVSALETEIGKLNDDLASAKIAGEPAKAVITASGGRKTSASAKAASAKSGSKAAEAGSDKADKADKASKGKKTVAVAKPKAAAPAKPPARPAAPKKETPPASRESPGDGKPANTEAPSRVNRESEPPRVPEPPGLEDLPPPPPSE